jgi:hypothetical protein
MIAGEVGEDPGREGQPVEPSLVEAVRRGFHGDGGAPAVSQRGEGRLQVDRTRRGERPGGGRHGIAPAIEGAERADAASGAMRIEEVTDERSGGGLAVGAGDADELHLRGGVTKPGARERQRRQTAVAHHHLGRGGRLPRFHHHGRGTLRHRVGDEPVPIGLRTAHRHVERAGRDAPAVGSDAARLRKRVRFHQEVGPAKRVEQLARANRHSSVQMVTCVPAVAVVPATGSVRTACPVPFTLARNPCWCTESTAARTSRP